jgi:actin-related protein
MFEGLPERLINDLKKLVGNQIKLRVLSLPKRDTVCWSGGSILSKLTVFKGMWITKA